MKEIRNRFAHHTEIGSFDLPEISSRCFNFTIVDKYVHHPQNGIHGDPSDLFGYEKSGAAESLKTPKDRYVLSAHIFSIGTQHATVNLKTIYSSFFTSIIGALRITVSPNLIALRLR